MPAQWQTHFASLTSDPAFPAGSSWLVDARRANLDWFDEDAIVDMAGLVNGAAERLRALRLAVVSPEPFERARAILEERVAVEALQARRFENLDGACAWLGIPLGEASGILDELDAIARASSEPTSP